jgi:hypothetical protein
MGDPFFKVHPGDWREIREHFAGGSGWLESMARTDVRWLLDQVYVRTLKGGRFGLARMPSANALKDVWGWTHWRTRQFLKREVAAEQASRTQSALIPHAVRIHSARSPHPFRTPAISPNSNTDENPHAVRTQSASIPHAVRIDSASIPPHARRETDSRLQTADPTLQTPDEAKVSAAPGLPLAAVAVQPPPAKPAALPAQQKLSGKRKGDVDPETFKRVANLWADEAGMSRGDRQVRAPQLKHKSGAGTRAIKAMIKAGVTEEEFAKLFWSHWNGPDDFNRTHDNGLKTIAKFHPRYLVRAHDQRQGTGPAAAPDRGRGANAHDFNDLSDLDGPPRDFIEGEIIDRTSTQGGHLGQ